MFLELIVLDRISDVAIAVWIKEYLGGYARQQRLLETSPGPKRLPVIDGLLDKAEVSKTNQMIGRKFSAFIRSAADYTAFEKLVGVVAEKLRANKQDIKVF